MLRILLPLFASVAARTLRLKWIGDPLPSRAVVLFWHGTMFSGWWSVRKRRPVALVSNSKDGGLLAAVLVRWGFKLARGSSGKKGKEALDVAIQMIERGEANTLAITPDGPRGPRHQLKRGGALAATALQLPLFMLEIRHARKKTFGRSWDKFEVPLPFSSVEIRPRKIDLETWPEATEAQHEWLAELSSSLTHAR